MAARKPTLHERDEHGVAVFEISGPADAAISEELDGKLSGRALEAGSRFVFDLSRCEFVPSHTWAVLISFARKAARSGGNACICGATGVVLSSYTSLDAAAHLAGYRSLGLALAAHAGARPPVPEAAADPGRDAGAVGPAAAREAPPARRTPLRSVIQLSLVSRDRGKVRVIGAIGTLDSTTTADLERAIVAALGEKRAVVVNLAKVEYVSSAGWGMLMAAAEEHRRAGSGLALAEMHHGIKSSYDLLAVGKRLKSFPAEGDALAELEKLPR